MSSVAPEVVKAFQMMWGLYPAPVMLIHKSREILAANAAAKNLGLPVGIKCHSLYPSETPCPGCRANAALKKGEALRKVEYSKSMGKFLDGYWVPVDGVEDVYVHFGNDISEYVRPELLPQQAAEQA